MVEQKFKIGDKVLFKGEQHEVVKATYTYFPDGAWWVYELENGAKAAAKDLTLATIPPKGDDVDNVAKNREKRGKFGK